MEKTMEFKEKRPLYLLKEIAEILRAENGCAWDRKQTPKSLRPYLIEETYELYDAIETENTPHIKEELGDYLYQAYAHAQIASENNEFTIDDVAEGIIEKLIRRHPHVFGDETIESPEEVSIKWEEIKKEEKSHRESVLDGVPNQLPALLKAYRIQQKASRVGFDWEDIKDPVLKLDEELQEFKAALDSGDSEDILDEAGDILFSIVNVFRFLKINPEEALRKSTDKFTTRFCFVEKNVADSGRDMNDMSLEELDSIWEESKKNE